MKSNRLIVLLGPTAVGKTSLAIWLAKKLGTEIVSADSRQFYEELKIGTARPSEDQLREVRHHFIGHLSIHDEYNISRFEEDALSTLENLFTKYQFAIMVGGSGLYIRAACEGIDKMPQSDKNLREKLMKQYRQEGIESVQKLLLKVDPDYYKKVDRLNHVRLIRAIEVSMLTGKPYSEFRKNRSQKRKFDILKIGLALDRNELVTRIDKRVNEMMKNGLLQEAEGLYSLRHLNALNTVGYKELFDYMDDKISLEEATEKIKINTRRYAKRQMTWFRQDKSIKWFRPEQKEEIVEMVRRKQ